MEEREIDEVLADLAKHPGWSRLHERARKRMDWQFSVIAKQLMQGTEIKPSVEYTRGFFAGMKHLLDNPVIELKKLERELEEAVARE